MYVSKKQQQYIQAQFIQIHTLYESGTDCQPTITAVKLPRYFQQCSSIIVRILRSPILFQIFAQWYCKILGSPDSLWEQYDGAGRHKDNQKLITFAVDVWSLETESANWLKCVRKKLFQA